MKTKMALWNRLPLLAAVCLCCAPQLRAQTAPVITTQPASQTNLAGTAATFTVAVSGAGPFTCQWQLNGSNLPNNIIYTVAGGGSNVDCDAAAGASLSYPNGVAFDGAGNMYIADNGNNRIRKVAANGIITTVAGTNSAGYSGDGGAAINACLNNPSGVAVDAFGNLYIADYSNSRIRKVATNGIISTVAGTNSAGYSGDGGAAVNAALALPSGVAVDACGNIYIADYGDNHIRKVATNGIITTVAGTNTSGFSGDGGAAVNAALYLPDGVAVDACGNIYIADTYNNRIRKVATNGIITTVAGTNSYGFSGDGGAAVYARLDGPSGVALDACGNIYIADGGNNRIRMVATNGIITTAAGNGARTPSSGSFSGDGGPATNAGLWNPIGVAFDAFGNLYIADFRNNRIREVLLYACYPTLSLGNVGANNAGSYSVVISNSYGSVTSAVATLTVLSPPFISVQPASQGILTGGNATLNVTASGTPPLCYSWYDDATNLVQSGANSMLAVQDFSTNNAGSYTIVVTNAYGSVTSQVATLTTAYPPSLTTPPASQTVLPGTNVTFSLAAAGTGPFTYQWQFNGTNLPNNIITTVAGNGNSQYAGDGGAATNTAIVPGEIAFDSSGNLYIADWANNRIRMVNSNGIISTVAGNGAGRPFLGAFSGDGGQATNASLNDPYGVALDAAGNIYIADIGNSRIRKANTNGIITTVAGDGVATYTGDGFLATGAGLNIPQNVAVDASGNLYIVDWNNYRIRKVDTHGIITTFAGTNSAGFSGDGGPATSARLGFSVYGLAADALAFDALGNLYIADSPNQRIRKVDANGIITTVAGNGGTGYSGDGVPATSNGLNYPAGVTVDAIGNLYIADQCNNCIRKVDTNGIITTVAGTNSYGFSGDGGPAINAKLWYPTILALDPVGNLFIVDSGNYRIREVHYSGLPTLALTNVSVTNAGNYSVVVTSPYGCVTSAVATLTVQAPPVITIQPTNQIVLPGCSAVFSVAAAGSGPVGYSWYLAGANLVQTGTNSALALPGVSANNAGIYTVVVSNPWGSVTSSVATLTLAVAVSMASQPVSETVLPGSNAIFSVAAVGTGPITCQWQFNGVNLPNTISTVAGNGTNGYSGDAGAATNAELYYPYGVAYDASGNLYIADCDNNRIRRVGANGIITTFAGTNSSGYSGDGGPAINACLYRPYGVTVDAAGNLYIADGYNYCIRRVATNGIITTVAGNGTNGYSGDGGPATNACLAQSHGMVLDPAGNLYIADTYNYCIRKVSANGIITTIAGKGHGGFSGDGGPATNATLVIPQGVALDASGNLYIADGGNNRIRKVDTNGVITTFAGGNSSGPLGDGGPATNAFLSNPYGVAVDAFGNLLIADYSHNLIRRVDPFGYITSLAGNGSGTYNGDGGPATNASLNAPYGLALDPMGNIYIGDSANARVRKVLAYASYPTLILTNVNATNAGSYSVVVSSPYNCVTSAVVTLNVAANPPQIMTCDGCLGFLSSQFGFNLCGSSGLTVVVDGSSNLVNWTPLFTNTVPGATPFYFSDPFWTNYPARFYRARLP